MTPTPITDAAVLTNPDVLRHFAIRVVPATVAADLERELTASRAEAVRFRDLNARASAMLEKIIAEIEE